MRTPTLAAVGATLVCALPAAARASELRCSARGGDPWFEYRSKGFMLDTDASASTAAALVKELETLQALLLKALIQEDVEIPGRVRVLAPADPGLFREIAPRNAAGYYRFSSFLEPTIVIPAPRGGLGVSETAAHELAHHLSFYLFPRQPMWFSEGLAHFMETVATAPVADAPATGTHLLRGQRAPARSVGLASERLQASVAVVQPVPARDLLSWTGSESETDSGRYHFWSWLLYHWLWNTRSKDFAAFQQRLAEAQDPAAAWLASFPDLDPSRPEAMSRMDDRLEAYRRDGRYLSYRVEAQADAAFSREPLGPADVHMLLLDARAAWPEGKAREALYAAEVQEALGEDPSQPSAIQARARLAKSSPAAPLRQAIAARPGDWRAWLLLGDSLGDAEAAEKEAAYRKATSLNPDGALAQNNLAWLLAKAGRAREALHFANRAADLAPRSPEVLDTLAFVAADLGKCPEALTLQQRAVALLAPGSGAPIRQNLAEYQKRCASRVAR